MPVLPRPRLRPVLVQRCAPSGCSAGSAQSELAQLAGVSASAISQAERGQRGLSLQTLLDLSARLDITIDELLRGEVAPGYRLARRDDPRRAARASPCRCSTIPSPACGSISFASSRAGRRARTSRTKASRWWPSPGPRPGHAADGQAGSAAGGGADRRIELYLGLAQPDGSRRPPLLDPSRRGEPARRRVAATVPSLAGGRIRPSGRPEARSATPVGSRTTPAARDTATTVCIGGVDLPVDQHGEDCRAGNRAM